MSVLILADHSQGKLSAATACTVTAARALSDQITLLITGHQCEPVAQQAACLTGVTKILVADDPAHAFPLAENIAPLLASLAADYRYILTPSTSMGKDILPRTAALLDCAQVSDVIRIESADTFMHPIYAGNALETVTTTDRITLLTIRPTAFAPAQAGGTAPIEALATATIDTHVSCIGTQTSAGERPDLTSARIVISGGRGIGSAENFAKLEQLADKLGAAVGASRAAVDAGYAPNDLQVGQTGKVVAPELYIAIGISGAIQHLAGMKDSKVIVAINKDENAPIFEIADYGLAADLFAVLPELEKAIS